ncbi:MAG TPA: ATP-binding cassette domain-containing protein [Glycomyces sp.]|nr:ATP-binding cassette domain-containing protein [Glycomyces sp.]
MSDRSDEEGHEPETSGSDGPSGADSETADRSAETGPPTSGESPQEPESTPIFEPAPIASDLASSELTATRIHVPLPGDTAETPVVPDLTEPIPLTADLEHPGGTPFLTATGLTATGRQGPIFTDISVTASLGQLVAVCGDGGDGRSSLLLALTGRFVHQGGTIEVDEQTKPGQIRRRFTIAQAGPAIRFEPYATVGACIKETTTVSKGAASRANIDAWLDRLAIGVDTGDTFGFLPRIDQIRFAIACAAACRTSAIAVDDVDTGLDTCGSERVFEALRTVADAGQLVLAACTRTDPPADIVVDLRGHERPASRRHERNRTGGHRK